MPEKIEKDQILFVPINEIGALGLDEKAESYTTFPILSKLKLFKDNNDKLVLIAIKYLGNGWFEEMTTGKKMSILGDSVRIGEGYKNEERILYDNDSNSLIPNLFPHAVTYKDEKSYEEFGLNIPNKFQFYRMLSQEIKRMSEAPLILMNLESCYLDSHDEKAKKQYLDVKDEERIRLLNEAEIKAKDYAEKAIPILLDEVNKFEPEKVTKEEIDMAYLENDLIDFEKRGKTR